MIKSKLAFLFLAGAAIISSCGSNATEATDAKKEAEASEKSVTYTIDASKSQVQWTGSKLAYSHTGLIDIKSGELSLEGKKITAGSFMIDMKTIRETGDVDPEKAAQLAGHLMDVDFFDAASFPTSSFTVTGVEEADGKYTISGNLSIKGVEKNISFPAKVEADGKKLFADAEFIINRNDWGVSYGSGVTGAVADQAIGDDIEFVVHLEAKIAE
jgi:polyisoprenoid-binding protein YceI